MPHKHTRRKGGSGDDSQYNLAPTTQAKPLPAFHGDAKQRGKKTGGASSKGSLKRKRATGEGDYKEDDTPREFARLMRLQATGKRFESGLDDGRPKQSAKEKEKKNRKLAQQVGTAKATASAVPSSKSEVPQMLPGERLRDFSARVDQALPVSGLARKGKVQVEGVKERQTKTEKRLHKMYAQWRVEDAKRKERLEELAEQKEEEDEEKSAALGVESLELPTGRKAKRKRVLTETDERDEDPWAVLRDKREKRKGLHDVVQAPPTLKPVREKFKVRNGAKVDVANIPNAAGSLKKREELGDARREVIERYRAMMKANKI